jgi:hypothetical protein
MQVVFEGFGNSEFRWMDFDAMWKKSSAHTLKYVNNRASGVDSVLDEIRDQAHERHHRRYHRER